MNRKVVNVMTDAQIFPEYMKTITARFNSMKVTAEKTFDQLDEDMLFWRANEQSNSISVIVKHMSGNMVSRWSDFLHTDGEKSSRDRDGEFEDTITNRNDLLDVWNEGWTVFLGALAEINEEHLLQKIYIRNEPHTVIEAIERQMYHYSYHIGQIVYIAKQVKSDGWKSLTIPKRVK